MNDLLLLFNRPFSEHQELVPGESGRSQNAATRSKGFSARLRDFRGLEIVKWDRTESNFIRLTRIERRDTRPKVYEISWEELGWENLLKWRE